MDGFEEKERGGCDLRREKEVVGFSWLLWWWGGFWCTVVGWVVLCVVVAGWFSVWVWLGEGFVVVGWVGKAG